jgi:ribosome recycling factor
MSDVNEGFLHFRIRMNISKAIETIRLNLHHLTQEQKEDLISILTKKESS